MWERGSKTKLNSFLPYNRELLEFVETRERLVRLEREA